MSSSLPREIDAVSFNRKDTQPSLAMHRPDGKSYYCPWIEDSITIHSDGNVSCGLDDPNALRSFGNIKESRIADIWANPEYQELRKKLDDGYRCRDCGLYQEKQIEEDRSRLSLPNTLIVEPTVSCNIRCINEACFKNNDPSSKTRDSKALKYEHFKSVVDELETNLNNVYFFNYGDPFVNPWAEDMLLYLRERCANVKIVTSTNGIPLAKPARAEKVAASAPTFIYFTIGGITQKSYERYHVRGNVDKALAGLENVCKSRAALGIRSTQIVWRYLLFNWNDSNEEVDRAIEMSKSFGVDVFLLYLTHLPPGGASFRFAPGTPNCALYKKYIDSALGYKERSGVIYPDDDGFFEREDDVSGLGPARWTSWKVRLSSPTHAKEIRLALTTNRPCAQETGTFVYIITPWRNYKFLIKYMQWTNISIHMPWAYRRESAAGIRKDILLFCPDYWFPVEDLGIGDTRCLGVLFRPEKPTFSIWKQTGLKILEADRSSIERLTSYDTTFRENTNSGRTQF